MMQMGIRGRLLIQALEDAKEARRKTGGGSRQDYGRVLKVSQEECTLQQTISLDK